MMSESFQTLLEGTLTAYGSPPSVLVAAASIKVPGHYQNIALPYVIHFPVSESPNQLHGSLADIRMWTYQVSIFGSSFEQCADIAAALRSVIGHCVTDDGMNVQYENGRYLGRDEATADSNYAGVHHWVMEFQVAESLAA